MKSKKTTRRALLTSMLALLICVSMLVGSTFAWFTDSVTSANNIIKSGNLDVTLDYYDAEAKEFKEVTGRTKIFNDDALWEPGYTEVAYLKIGNAGSLALKYQLGVNVVEEIAGLTKDNKEIKLSEHLVFKVIPVEESEVGTYTRETAMEVAGTELGLKSYNSGTKTLKNTGDADYVALIIYMPTTVGNEANHNGTKVPKIEMGVNLVATQVENESDSFGKDYDKDSTYPNVSAPVGIPDEDVAEPVTLYKNGVEVTVPAATVNALPAGVTSISLVFDDPVVENNTLSFPYFELVDQNGAKIDLESNTAAIEVTLPAQTTFAPGTAVDVYHDGVKMVTTSVADDGSISYSATHFCQIDVTQPKDAYYVGTYDEFYNEVYYGGTVIPTADIALPKFLVSPNAADIYLNGKNITGSADFYFYAPVKGAKLSINGAGTVTTSTGYVSFATSGGTFTVNGGTFNLGSTKEKGHFFTQNSGKTIINGGTFISEDADTPIVYCINGFVEITGGFFQNTANPEQALLSMGNNVAYASNQKITLSGGTFVNWNPMDSAFARPWTDPDVPALLVLAEGYQMISETQTNGDVWYTVVPCN